MFAKDLVNLPYYYTSPKNTALSKVRYDFAEFKLRQVILASLKLFNVLFFAIL